MSVRRVNAALISSLFLALFLVAGCGSMSNPPVDPDAVKNAIVGKVWVCEAMFAREIQEGADVTIEFLADGTVKGNGGCNDFSGTYTLTGDAMKIGPLKSTKKSCGPVADEREFTLLTYLPRVVRANVEDEELSLFTDTVGSPILFTEKGASSLW